MKARRWQVRMFLVALIGAGLLAPGYAGAKILDWRGCHYPATPKDKKCWEYGYEVGYDTYTCFVDVYDPSAPSYAVVSAKDGSIWGRASKRADAGAGRWAFAEIETQYPYECIYSHPAGYSVLGMGGVNQKPLVMRP